MAGRGGDKRRRRQTYVQDALPEGVHNPLFPKKESCAVHTPVYVQAQLLSELRDDFFQCGLGVFHVPFLANTVTPAVDGCG